MGSRWGLGLRLRYGLDSGLMLIVSGAPEVLAGGSPPVEVFALFANLCANVSVSLQGQAKAKQMS